MKKKFIVTVTALLGALASTLCMAACNKDKGKGDTDPPDVPDEPTGVTYTVVFDANGGKFDAEIEIEGETVDDGAVISSDGKTATYTVTAKELDEPLRMPERAQYAFSGWAKDTDGEALWNFESDELEGDTTLYAVWAVSFDFARSDDRSGYIVRGIGGLSGDVEVPETHNGKPVTAIANDAFKNSRSLTGIIIPDSVTEIGTGAFKNATKLESVTIGEGVTEIPSEAFCDCAALVELGLPNSLKKINYDAFGTDGMRSLLEVKYAGSIDKWCGIEMDCSSDKKANPLSNGKAELYINGRAVTDITVNAETVNRWAFYGCKTIESVTIGKNVKTIGESAFLWNNIETLTFAQESTLDSIGESAFESINVTELKLPDSLKSVGYRAFRACNAMTKLDLGGTKTVSNEAFDGCYSLANINLRSAEYLGASAFGGNSVINEDGALASVTIPETTWYIGRGCFGDQPALSSVTFASNATWKAYALRTDDPAETVTTANLSGAATARKLKETAHWIRLAGTLTTSGNTVTGVASADGIGMLEVPKGVTKIAVNAFKDFKGLRYLTIERDVTEIGDGFIDGCDNIMTVTVAVNNGAYASTGVILYKKNGSILWMNPSVKKTRYLTIPSGVKSISSGMFTGMDIASLQIPETVTEIADGAFEDCKIEQAEIPAYAAKHIANDKLRNVELISGTEIAADAFKNCMSLEYVWLPDSLTTIGARAFENCGSLTKVKIPNKVTEIGRGAFDGCAIVLETDKTRAECGWSYDGVPVVYDSLNNSVADDGYVYTVIDGIRYALKDGKATVAKQSSVLTTIKIPASVEYGDTTYEVTGIADGAFDGCGKLTSISIASGIGGYTSYNGILYNGDKTEIVLVPKGITGAVTIPSSVTAIGDGAFKNCVGITSITVGANVKSVGTGVFDGCVGITSAKIPASFIRYLPKSALKSVEIVGEEEIGKNMFSGCDELETVKIGASVVGIGENAFKDCEGLRNVIISDGVTYISANAFDGCVGLTEISIPNSVERIGKNAFADCMFIETVDGVQYVDKWIVGSDTVGYELTIRNGTIGISDGAFENKLLMSLRIPESVRYVGSGIVSGCNKVIVYCEVSTRPDKWNSDWAYRAPVIWDCNNNEGVSGHDTYVEIGGLRYQLHDAEIRYAYVSGQRYDLSGAITIPSSVTYKGVDYRVEYIDNYAFAYCSEITSVTVPSSVEMILDHAFIYCVNLENISLPNGLSIYKGIFTGCDKLIQEENGIEYVGKYVVSCNSSVSGEVTLRADTVGIGEYAFRNKKGITSVVIPNNATVVSLAAFDGCTNLASVTIGNNVTVIGPWAFQSSGLTSVVIPNSVKEISQEAFQYCKSLTEITFKGTKAQWNAIKKGLDWDYGTGDYIIHCTDGDITKS